MVNGHAREGSYNDSIVPQIVSGSRQYLYRSIEVNSKHFHTSSSKSLTRLINTRPSVSRLVTTFFRNLRAPETAKQLVNYRFQKFRAQKLVNYCFQEFQVGSAVRFHVRRLETEHVAATSFRRRRCCRFMPILFVLIRDGCGYSRTEETGAPHYRPQARNACFCEAIRLASFGSVVQEQPIKSC